MRGALWLLIALVAAVALVDVVGAWVEAVALDRVVALWLGV